VLVRKRDRSTVTWAVLAREIARGFVTPQADFGAQDG
jgi:hypothetical protein